MAIVFCKTDDCKYWSDGECTHEAVYIDWDRECDSFEDKHQYINLLYDEIYVDEFYKSVHGPGGYYKKKCMGEKIVINGVEFFADDRNPVKEERRLTHGRTGYLCPTESYLEANFEDFLKKEKAFPDVMSLPDITN